MNSDVDVADTINTLLDQTGLTVPDVEFGRRCAAFAFEIYSAAGSAIGLASEHAKLVIAAALLHEVGSGVSRRDEHRKTYDLVRGAKLPRFSERERLIAACAARYCGGPYPSIEHAGFGDMSDEDQRAVRRIAAIGRVAIALDASHLGVIERIQVKLHEHAVELVASAAVESAVERDSLREAEGSFHMLTQVRLTTFIQVSDH